MPEADAVQKRITGFWSTVASEYEAHKGNVPARESSEYAAWTEALRRLLPNAPADVLDIGTGTGFMALIAAALGHRVTGIDLSEQMLAEARGEARRRRLDVTFARDDAVSPAFPPEQFDAIVCRHFIWTLREPATAFGNWRKLLRPGGCVVAIDGFRFAPTEADAGSEEPGLFEQYYTRETRAALPAMGLSRVEPIVALFEGAGFSDVRVSDLAAVHRLSEQPPSSAPWYVVVAYRP